jgi:hypothetical protein
MSGTEPNLMCRYSTFLLFGVVHFTIFCCAICSFYGLQMCYTNCILLPRRFCKIRIRYGFTCLFFLQVESCTGVGHEKTRRAPSTCNETSGHQHMYLSFSYVLAVTVGRIVFLRWICSQMRTQILILIGLLVQQKN